ncbi:hypothetical protein Droror1_Dr00023842 [Drosera rotundifolia]
MSNYPLRTFSTSHLKSSECMVHGIRGAQHVTLDNNKLALESQLTSILTVRECLCKDGTLSPRLQRTHSSPLILNFKHKLLNVASNQPGTRQPQDTTSKSSNSQQRVHLEQLQGPT